MRRRIVLHDLWDAVSPRSHHLTATRRFELHFVMFCALAIVEKLERRDNFIVVAGTGEMVFNGSVMCSCADMQAVWVCLKSDGDAGTSGGDVQRKPNHYLKLTGEVSGYGNHCYCSVGF
jgi:hypothetical protein